MENQVRFRPRVFIERRLSWSMKMTREDPQLLPICEKCGKYKGVGPCKNISCPESVKHSEEGEPMTREDNPNESVNNPCSICGKEQVAICSQCGKGFCQTHSEGADLNLLGNFHQHVGTCVECQKVVCENCWILNPNGDIVCLTHLEEERKTRGFH